MVRHSRFTPRATNDDRPNILILMSDQHRFDLMTCAGRDRVPTPHLDRLAIEGTRYPNACCSSPVCDPSRMSFLTGDYPHTIGLAGNYDALDFRERTMAHHFSEAGYLPALIGKMHFLDACKHGFEYHLSVNDWLSYLGPKTKHYADEIASNPITPKFFDSVRDGGSGFPDVDGLWEGDSFWPGEVTRKDMTHMRSALSAEDTLDFFVARESVKFMRRHRDDPFMLIAGFLRPHPPMYPPAPWDQRYPVADIRLSPVPASFADYPGVVRKRAETFQALGPDRLKADRSGYYGNLAFLDHCIGHVLDGLEEAGLRDRTIVVYCSDHGDMDGDHGLYHKAVMYDPAVKIPLIIRDPAVRAKSAVDVAPVSLMDLYPTLAERVGIGAPSSIDGRSFAGDAAGRDAAFAEFERGGPGGMSMVRTATHKLIRYDHPDEDEDQLFDLIVDPGETRNLSGQKDMRDVESDLRERLTKELGA